MKVKFVAKDMGRPRYFLEVKLLTIKMEHFFLKVSILWIYYMRLDYWAASQCVFLWILMLICGMSWTLI